MNEPDEQACPECSWPLTAHDVDVNFGLPSEVANWDEDRIGSEVDLRGSFLKAGDRFFIRGLFPIFLRRDHVLVVGIWVEVSSETLGEVSSLWDSPAYSGLSFSGAFANELPPWPGMTGIEVRLEVRHQNELPYVVSSENAKMSGVIDGRWPHEFVLRSMGPSAAPGGS